MNSANEQKTQQAKSSNFYISKKETKSLRKNKPKSNSSLKLDIKN